MTDNLVINAGRKRLTINGDPENVIEFDPTDVLFAERFYQLILEFDKKVNEFTARSDELDAATIKNEDGLPDNMPDKFALAKEAGAWIRGQIDNVFGKGTSQKVFGDSISLDAFGQFFDGITPHIQKTRASKVAKYQNTAIKKKKALK